jgi:hypothetical protein
MANGAQAQKIQFKPRKTVTEIQPDAPEGEWEVTIPKGRSKIFATAPEKGGDPGINWEFKLLKAEDEKNESFQGSTINQRTTFYDQSDSARRKAANMQLQWMRGLCEACDVDFSEVYPESLESSDDLSPLIDALEGKSLTIWTVHRKSTTASGEEMLNVDIRFKKPGAGLVSKTEDDDDNDRPGKKPAKKGGRR